LGGMPKLCMCPERLCCEVVVERQRPATRAAIQATAACRMAQAGVLLVCSNKAPQQQVVLLRSLQQQPDGHMQ
jgi:hypothetical protein